MKYANLTRLFVPSSLENETITISSLPDIHYLANVMRKKAGHQLLIFNAKDGEYLVEIIEINHKKLVFKPLEQTRQAEPEKQINLIFAPIKQTRIGFLLEKATELGATKLTPVQTQHSVIDKINLSKWHIYVKEAAEQCGRLSVPVIEPLVSLASFLTHWPKDENIILCNEKEKTTYFLTSIKRSAINILIGPEGGFSTQELALLTAQPFISSVHLGNRILRAETAALAALVLAEELLNNENELIH